MNVAQYLVAMLAQAQVKRIWGVTGDSLNGIADSLRADSDIAWIGVRHEEVAAFAAGAQAELTGELGVCAGSCGPGNMHLINGVYNAYRNRVPMLVIAADIPSSEIGTHYFQETNPKALFSECSHYCEKITHPAQAPQVIETAIRQALLNSSVSVIVLPGDVALQPIAQHIIPKWHSAPKSTLLPRLDTLKQAAELINKAKNITLLCGAGCRDAQLALINLAQTVQSPVVHALRGKAYVEPNNPYDVGLTGLIGFSSGYHAMENADVIIVIGSGFPYRHFYPQGKIVIQIDNDPQALGRHVQLDVGICGDVAPVLNALTPLLTPKTERGFLDACLVDYQKNRAVHDKLTVIEKNSKIIHPQAVAKLMSQYAAEDAIFTCDVGTPTLWSARYLTMNGQRRLFGSFNHGSMANALAMALGLQACDTKRQVIAFCGDGGFSMLMGDLLTLKPYHLPIKILVLNNRSLGFVDMEMKAAGFVSDSTDLVNPSFADIANACGIPADIAAQPHHLEDKIKRWLASDGPALLEVMTDKHELSIPPTISADEVKGFSLYTIKAVLNGHGNELIDIAKVNLLR